jgi:pimeloyl-ACP methyl ester carboxylesterase
MSDPSKTIVFMHGMYMNAKSWTPWVERATQRGFTTHAPSWPFHDDDPTYLRAHLDPGLGALTFGDITDHYKAFIDTLPERPVLVGHSIGGLLTQKLVNDGYASAGVAVSPAPPRGIISFDPTFFRANLPHANPFAGNKPVIMTPKRFHFTFTNTMTETENQGAFNTYVVPESRNVPRSTLTAQGRIDFGRDHVPLLFLTGDSDNLIPLSLVKKNIRAYKPATGSVELRAFAGRSHFICNQEGWEEVADAAFDWIDALDTAPTAVDEPIAATVDASTTEPESVDADEAQAE